MRKKILLLVLLVIIALVAVYFYTYKGHRDIASETSDFVLTVDDLNSEFATNDSLANHKYADKTIEIYGKITALDVASQAIIIDKKLAAVFADSIMPVLSLEDSIRIKGRFVGYDDLLEEFKIDQATLIE